MSVKGIFIFCRVINILTAIGLNVLGVFAIINILDLGLKIFLIPSPIFVIIFGWILLGAEFKIKYVLKNVPFMGSFFGRGIFNIYLSSVAFWFLENYKVAAWASAISLFVSGVIYITFHCGWSKQLNKYLEQDKSTAQDDGGDKYAKAPVRQNFF